MFYKNQLPHFILLILFVLGKLWGAVPMAVASAPAAFFDGDSVVPVEGQADWGSIQRSDVSTLYMNDFWRDGRSCTATLKIGLKTDQTTHSETQIRFKPSDEATPVFNFHANDFVTPGPMIKVYDGATTLTSDGDALQLGTVQRNDVPPQKTFTVMNQGDATLTSISLVIPSGYRLLKDLPITLEPNQSDSFTVEMQTRLSGSITGQILIQSNDADLNPFKINLTGTVTPFAEVKVIDNGTTLTNGDSVNMGTYPRRSPQPRRTFQIMNKGDALLSVSGLSVPAGFSVTSDLPTTLGLQQPTCRQETASTNLPALESFGCVTFLNRIWVIGGSDTTNMPSFKMFNSVWSSTDGVSWKKEIAYANFPARAGHQCVVHQGRIWLLGGYSYSGYLHDIWSSADGINWRQETAAAEFPARSAFAALEYGGRMWVMGGVTGSSDYTDVWSSADGIHWRQETPDGGYPAGIQSAFQFKNRMWVVGREVWSSADGVTWRQEASNMGFSSTSWYACTEAYGQIWLMGGYGYPNAVANVWTSGNGRVWKKFATPANFPGRFGHSMILFNDRVWIISGCCNDTSIWSLYPDHVTSFTLAMATDPSAHYSGAVRFKTSDPSNSLFSFNIEGTVNPAPQIRVYDGVTTVSHAGTSINLGSAKQGATPLSHTIRIENIGDAPLNVTSTTATPGFRVVSAPSSTIPVGEAATLTVEMATDSGYGLQTGSVDIASNDPAQPLFRVNLQGWLQPLMDDLMVYDGETSVPLNGGPLDFGITRRNAVAPRKTFRVESRLGRPVSLSGLHVPDGFRIASDLPTSVGLVNHQWRTVETNTAVVNRFGCRMFNFHGKLWIFGGEDQLSHNDIWSSDDGTSWTQRAATSAISARLYPGCAELNGRMYLIGGCGDMNGQNPMNDVWSSADGVTWRQETANAGFSPRYNPRCFAFHERLWVIGGFGYVAGPMLRNDIWSSADGVTWRQELSDPRIILNSTFAPVVFNDRIWLLIGKTNDQDAHGIWSSDDGVNWRKETTNIDICPRYGMMSLVHNRRIYAMDTSHCWSSADGINWRIEISDVLFSDVYTNNYQQSIVSFRDSIYVPTLYDWCGMVGKFWAFRPFNYTSFSIDLLTTKTQQPSGTVQFDSDVPEANPYKFSISGTVLPSPTIRVVDGQADIPLGGMVDVGSVAHSGQLIQKSFRVENHGDGPLTISGVNLPPDCRLIKGLAVVDSADTLTLEFQPNYPGYWGGEVAILSDDPQNSKFTFNVQGWVPPRNKVLISDGNTTITNGGGPLDFGSLWHKATPLRKILTIKNMGDEPVVITQPTVPAGYRWLGTEPTTVGLTLAGWRNVTANGVSPNRTHHATVVFNNRLWVIGGYSNGPLGEVWSSANGVQWRREIVQAPFTARYGHTCTVFKGRIWLIGGEGNINSDGIYSSADGITWRRENSNKDFAERLGHACVVYNDRMWVVGGSFCNSYGYYYNDVWSSADGLTWRKETSSAAFPVRSQHTLTVFNGRMWVIGGANKYLLDDVWSSTDGITWRSEKSPSDYYCGHASLVIGNRMWLIGSYYTNEMHYTDDGVNWVHFNPASSFAEMDSLTCADFNGRLWLISGADVWSADKVGDTAPLWINLLSDTIGQFSGQVRFETNVPADNPYQFTVTGTVAARPVIQVFDGNKAIKANSSIYMGSMPRHTTPLRRSFRIENPGILPLSLTDLQIPSWLRVTDTPASTLPANGMDTLTLELNTTQTGDFNGMVILTTNDPVNPIFKIYLSADVNSRAEVAVFDGATTLTNGGGPVTFGTIQKGDPAPSKMFMVKNMGDLTLQMNNLTVPSGYSIVSDYSGSIGPNGDGAIFAVKMQTDTPGLYAGDILFNTNDPLNNTFRFHVQGTVLQTSGTVVVNVTPLKASWSFVDAFGQVHAGMGNATLPCIPTGKVVMTWPDLDGYDGVSMNPETTEVTAGGTAHFTKIYQRQTGTVVVKIMPDSTSWTLTDGDGVVHQGKGNATLHAIPTGMASLSWSIPSGYEPPMNNPQSQLLINNQTLVFQEILVPNQEGTSRREAQILRYLLGLSTDPSGLDINGSNGQGDGTIDVADLIATMNTIFPGVPTTPMPRDLGIEVMTTTRLDWADAIETLSYDLYLWADGQPKPAKPLVSGLTTSDYVPTTPLAYKAKYYWQVIARRGLNQTPGPIWTFTTKPQLVLISPNGGQIWTRGTNVQVHYTANTKTAGTSYRIELWRGTAKAVVLKTYSSNTSGDRTETLPVASTLTPASDYRVRVISIWLESHGGGSTAWDESDQVFTIK